MTTSCSRRSLGLAVAAAATALLSLVPPLSAAERTMVLGMDAGELSSLDPAFVATGADEFIVRQMFNTLVSPPDGTLEMGLDQIRGELAESWSVSEDGKTWTFKLKPGIKWHKGYGEVPAEDVKFSYCQTTLGTHPEATSKTQPPPSCR